MEQLKRYPTIGVCGLDCGLCPRFYTKGKSRCPGCGGPGFFDKHPSCSFITCCVKKKGFETCGECPEFPCPKFKTEKEYRQVELSSSYPPYWTSLSNLRLIQKQGTKELMRRQAERIELLRIMIKEFDDGRSRAFFCRATTLLDPMVLKDSLRTARMTNPDDISDKAKVLKGILEQAGERVGIRLKIGCHADP